MVNYSVKKILRNLDYQDYKAIIVIILNQGIYGNEGD